MLAAGLLLLVSSLAHSLLGWPQIRPQLVAAGGPEDLVGALAVGWHFGGVAMAAFGVIVLLAWRRARAGATGGFEAVFVLRSFAPFFLIFIIPGAGLAACVGFRRRLPGGARTVDRPR
jgi:hypothetical protein